MSSWTAASSNCSRPVNNYVHVKTADLYRPNARLIQERQGYQVLTPFWKLGYNPLFWQRLAHARHSDDGVGLMSGQIRRVGLALCAMLVVTGNAGAQVIPMSFAEMVNAADTIVVAEAIDSRAEWVTTGSSRVIVTRMTFRVTDTLKGTQRLLLPLEFLGGTVGDVGFEVSGVPTFDCPPSAPMRQIAGIE